MTELTRIEKKWTNPDGSTVKVRVALKRTWGIAMVEDAIASLQLQDIIEESAILGDEITILGLLHHTEAIWPTIGRHCKIGEKVTLRGRTEVETGTIVEDGSNLGILKLTETTRIEKLSHIGKAVRLHGYIGEKCRIGNDAVVTIKKGYKLPPHSKVGAYTKLTDFQSDRGPRRPVTIGTHCVVTGTLFPAEKVSMGDHVTVEWGVKIEEGVSIPTGAQILSRRRVKSGDIFGAFPDGTIHIGDHGADVVGTLPSGVQEALHTAFAQSKKQAEDLAAQFEVLKQDLDQRLRTMEGRFRAQIQELTVPEEI